MNKIIKKTRTLQCRISTLQLALFVALGCVSVTSGAAIVADTQAPGNQQPTIISAANGTPQVNIQTPSAAGVSRNVYSQFDVAQQGVVLNNSQTNVQTELAGMVTANPWLANGTAKVILNEVNSLNASQLNGFIEVAGQQAQVVIANPAGITCDGCGFINAHRATLTTGQAQLNNGQLTGYDVDRGEIVVQGKGMDSRLQGSTDLIARAVKVNAGLWARELNVTAGRNIVDAAHQTVTAKAPDTSVRPQVAIDVAQLGGMYANSIRLVGTETGVGVHNAGSIGAAAGDVVLRADGTLVNAGTLKAAENVQVSVTETVDNTGGLLYGEKNLAVVADTVVNRDTPAEGAGIQGDSISINAATLDNDSGAVLAGTRLDLTLSGTLSNDRGLVSAGRETHITAQTVVNRDARIEAGETLTIAADTLNNHSAAIESAGDMVLNVGTLNNINDRFVMENVLVSQEAISEYLVDRLNDGIRYNDNDYTIYIYQDQVNILCIVGVICHTTDGDRFTHFSYTRTITEDRIAESDPGQIIAGGNLTITAGHVLNDKSQIVAGGTLTLQAESLDNVQVEAFRQINDTGTATAYSRHQQKGSDSPSVKVADYRPPEVIQAIDLRASTLEEQDLSDGSGNRVQMVGPDLRLPDNSQFRTVPDSTSPYLVESDPRFTNQKQWLSSDYMLAAFTLNPDNVHKRLGDGYYEQRLVREQIIALTGQRYLDGQDDDDAQYKALMNNGIAFGQAYSLTPGVALTAEQMRLLTGDMVWLVTQTVQLPDGSTEQVLVPQLYAVVRDGDLAVSGALLAGRDLGLTLSGDLTNSGQIAGRESLRILADNIDNQGGQMAGADVLLQAQTDIRNTGGTLAAGESLQVVAGRDIHATTTTRSAQSDDGNFARTTIDRVAGFYVQQPDGKLLLQSGRDIHLAAAQVVNGGENGDTTLSAGRDLNLTTVTTGWRDDLTWGEDWLRQSGTQQAGAEIIGSGSLTLQAGNNIDITAGIVSAGQQLSLAAGNDITLAHALDTDTLDQRYKATGSSSIGSKTTVESRNTFSHQTVSGSQLGGESITVQAGQDLSITGSSVAATGDIRLSAGRDLSILAASAQQEETHFYREKTSGISGSGGIGVSFGTRTLKTTEDGIHHTSTGSTLGSTQGNVEIHAVNDLTVTGSDVLAGKDLSLTGSTVNILAAENQSQQTRIVEQKQSGLTLALSGAVGSAINSAVTTAREAGSESSGRLAALQGMKAALTGVQAYQGVSLAQAAESEGSMIGINLSYGTQSSKSTRTSTQSLSQGSALTAGNNLTLNATGTDINVQGSQLQAGQDVSLSAARDVNLTSATEWQTLEGKNESQGASVGVGINFGQGSNGISLNASVNKGKGSESGNGTSHRETTLSAGSQLTVTSGRDTTLTGAQASGETVTFDVGRNLTLTSQQDTDNYDSKQQNISAGGSVSMGGGSGSLNLSQDKMHSRWQSVQEQTGIFAGQGGFDVTVGEHTQLNGAVIGATAGAENNRLETGTLGFSDIENSAEYRVEHQSVGISSGGSPGGQFAGNLANTLLTGVNSSGSDSSTTKSAVSDGTIVIRDEESQQQDVNTLSRDVEHANQTLSPIFDKEKEQNRLREAQLIGEIGAQIGDIARTQGDINGLNAAKETYGPLKENATEKERAAYLEMLRNSDEYKAEMQQWGTGSAIQQGIQAATAAIQGLAGGNIAQAVSGAAAPYLAEQIHYLTTDANGKVNTEANLMAHAVVGAVTAYAAGNSALAGATGAAMGEFIAQQLYPNIKREDLSEEQRQTISALGSLAAGLAGGVVGNSTADAVAGAQAGKNAVENNALKLPSGLMSYGQAVASWNQYAVDNNLTPEQTQAGLHRLAQGDIPEGADITKAIVDGYTNGVLIAGAWYLGPAATIGKAVGGGVIAEIANGSYQWFDLNQPGNENKTWDYKSSVGVGIAGMLAPGRTLWQNVGIAAGGAFFTSGPDVGSVGGAVAGTSLGGQFGKYAPGIVNSLTGKEAPGFIFDTVGSFGSEFLGGYTKELLNTSNKQDASKKETGDNK